MGEDITYSGTVAAAMEGVIQGIPSIAISQVLDDNLKAMNDLFDFKVAKTFIYEFVKKILTKGFPLDERKLININIPPTNKYNGYKITKAGYRVYGNDYKMYHDPKGEEFYWIGLHPLIWEVKDDILCDFEAIKSGFVSITPIKLDLTSYEDIKKLKDF